MSPEAPTAIPEGPRSTVIAAVLAMFYVLLCEVYILTSTHAAARGSETVEQLERIENLKGTIFVGVSGAAFFVLALWLLRRIEQQGAQIESGRRALVASEHRALSGIFAASIAHDINNLAMVAQGSADLLSEPTASDAAKAKSTEALRQAFLDLIGLSRRLMSLGRGGATGPLAERDLVAVLERALSLARRHERVKNCRVTSTLGPPVILPLDESLVDRMLLNLVLNAADATGRRGRIAVRVVRNADAVAVEVHDDGPGVAEDAAATLFDPFTTSKPDGLGLGLLSVRVCAQTHGGSVTVGRSDLGGACFRVEFPLNRRMA